MDTVNLHKNLGLFIKRERMKKFISQEELAWQCQLNVNSLGRIERAEIELKFVTLVKILKALEVKLSELQQITDESLIE